MALFNELTFSTYARPGELMKARVCDVVGKLKKEDNDIIILAPFERGEESKTGIFDEVLILDDKRLSSLGPLTVGMAAKKEKKQGPQADLWDFNAKKYLEVWRSCVAALGAEELAKSPYQNRHGGASRDHLQGVRSVQAIQRRGRWAADSSARIYDKPGRLQQILNKMPRNLETFGEQVRLNFAEYFQGGTFQLPKEQDVAHEPSLKVPATKPRAAWGEDSPVWLADSFLAPADRYIFGEVDRPPPELNEDGGRVKTATA
eukprot:g18069.t1